MEQPTWGGRRKNSGRKSIKDKKVAVYIFVQQSVIDKLGGIDKVKEIMKQSIQ